MTLPKGYFGGYSGTNGYNAKSLKNWEVYRTARQEARLKGKAGDYNFLDCVIEENKLFNLFIQRFSWQNLPCPAYYLEQSLLFSGLVVAFKDPDYGDIVLPATILERNLYDEPIIVSAIGRNYNRVVELTPENAVLLYDNPLFVPPYLHLSRVAQILGDLNRTCEVYSKGLKKPLYFHASADTARSIKITAERTLKNEEYTVLETIPETNGDVAKAGILDPSSSSIQQFNTPHTSLELKGLFDHKQAYCADALANYGIRGASGADKMAQTNDTEIETANTSASTQFNAALELRRKFAKDMNKFFFKKVSVNTMIPDNEGDEGDEGDKEGEDNDRMPKENKPENGSKAEKNK